MKIETIIHREGGSDITLGDKVYHFKPDADGRHVCEVEDKKHIQRFLGIPEGYRIYDPDENSFVPEQPPAETGEGTGEEPADGYDMGDEAESTDETTDEGVDAGDEGANDESANNGLIPEGGDDQDEAETTDEGDEDSVVLDREALAVQYAEKFGQRPHGKWDAERIRKELEA